MTRALRGAGTDASGAAALFLTIRLTASEAAGPGRYSHTIGCGAARAARARALGNGVFFAAAIYGPPSRPVANLHGGILADAAGKEGVYIAEVDLAPGVYDVELREDGLPRPCFRHVHRKERRPSACGRVSDW
jgi:hypothetical protein